MHRSFIVSRTLRALRPTVIVLAGLAAGAMSQAGPLGGHGSLGFGGHAALQGLGERPAERLPQRALGRATESGQGAADTARDRADAGRGRAEGA
mgnify:FL=1